MTSATLNAIAATGPRHAKSRRGANARRGVSALMYASQQADVDQVRKILRDQPEALQSRDRTGKTPLHYCSTSDNIRAAQAADLLVMAAPDLVDKHDEDGFTPLHLAVISGNIPLVTFLLANKADVNAVDNEKHTVVHWATVCGETAALSAVLAAGAPVSTPDVHGGYPLHYAAQMCGGEKDAQLGLQVLQHLLTHTDIHVSVEDGDGRQPLLWAASAGSAKAVLALIRAGAGVEAPDKDGLTALHCAASRGHTDVIDSLLTLCGASPDVIDSNGCTALHYAVTLGHADATALLLAHGADPNRQDRKGRSPAHCGCAKGQFETVKIIGGHGGNLWLRNARGDLPLHEASASGRRDLVRWLLDMRPSQVNARNNDGRCPLHLAALNDNVDMCKILLDSGAQINPILRTSKNTFMSPLDCALQRGFRSTAKYLQLHGGVPASRIGDVRVGHNHVNMQIRDDVTFWGDTSSSDSERENGHSRNKTSSQRIHRKKLMNKFERRKISTISDSDFDSKITSRLENQRKMSEKHRRGKTPGLADSATSSIDFPSNKRKTTAGRFDYSNEIVINGKTEINIHQTREITISAKQKNNEVPSNIKSAADNLQVEQQQQQQKRPKSAKISAKSVSAKSKPESSAKRKTKAEVKLKSPKSLPESKKQTEKPEEIIVEKTNLDSLPDQQSLMSNTSEDVEDHKDLVVEASVHEPPKTEQEIQTQEEIIEEVKATPQPAKELKEMGVQWEDGVIVDSTSSKETESKEEEVITVQEIVINSKEENKDSEIVAEVVTEKIANEQQNESKDVETPENQITEDREETEEVVPKIESAPDDAKEVTDKVQAKENDVTIDENTVETDKSNKNDVAKEKPEECNSESKIKEELLETEEDFKQEEKLENLNKDQKNELNTEITTGEKLESKLKSKESTEQESEEVEKKRKKKTKKKSHRKKESNDPAYEIIYKTIGESEDTESAEKALILPETAVEIGAKTLEDSHQQPEKDYTSDSSSESSSLTSSATIKEHKSFRVLNEQEAAQIETTKPKKRPFLKKQRSRSEETRKRNSSNKSSNNKSKIPLPKNEKYLSLPDRKIKSSLESRVPSLPNINEPFLQEKQEKQPRCESNMSAPPLASIYSDNEAKSGSDEPEVDRSSATGRKKRLKKRSKSRPARSAGSDYESSNVIDSGFEPSPRSSRIPKWRHMSDRGVNMTSVTQSIQSNIRRFHLERKIFQHLLELKRMQIRAGQHNEAMLVKRAIDLYHQSCAATVGAGRYVPEDYTFRSFEKFLYLSLRKLQRNGVGGADHLKGLPESPSAANPLLCTQSTHRCMHATHAYTGIPCAAYLPKMDHHTIPKIGFSSSSAQCKPGTAGFLPTINPKKSVTLELCHGNDKQLISLPADRLDHNKRYYVTFTVKGAEEAAAAAEQADGHTHSKSD